MSCSRGCCPDQRTHYRSIGISSAAMPSRSGPVVAVEQREKRWEKDHAAYRSLRKQGIQPKAIDGVADLASRANDAVEIESGQNLSKTQLAAVKELS